MDANGTHFHLLLGRNDWGTCSVEQTRLHDLWSASPPRTDTSPVVWETEREALTLRPRLFRFTAAPKDVPPTPDNRRGAGRDRYGNWYWIDDSRHEVLVNSIGDHRTSRFWKPGDGTTCEPAARFGEFAPKAEPPPPVDALLSGLAVTEDHYLVVGVLDPPGLLIFDLHAGGPPRQLPWPAAVAFAPFDLAPRPSGGVWILDRAHRCYWELDRHFNVVNPEHDEVVLAEARPDDFQPVDIGPARGRPRRTFPRGLALHVASPLALHDPIAIEALPDGSVLILDNPPRPAAFSTVYHYRFDAQTRMRIVTSAPLDSVLDIVEADQRSDFRLIGHDFALTPRHDGPDGAVPGLLYVVAADGNQTFAFRLMWRDGQLYLTALPAYLPMRLFGGKGLVATETQVYYDFDTVWIPLIEQRRPRYVTEATLLTPPFDGVEPDCVWHRLFLDACLPPETSVEVQSRTANDTRELAEAVWQEEPRLYRRGDGAELPFVRRHTATTENDGVSSTDGDSTWELLFQQARGRFLQLQLRLRGNERTTPCLRALRAYYPRFSYLTHYLPAVYRERAQSASFLDRFLANAEGLYTTLEDKIAAVQTLFDVRSAPAETLEWLASWFGVAVDPAWDETRRRLFIAHAMEFFQYRGTLRGLLMALRLVLERCPDDSIFTDPLSPRSRAGAARIIETFRARRTPAVVFGDPTDQSGLRVTTLADRWRPTMGRDALHQRYAEALTAAGITSGEQRLFPLQPAADEVVVWTTFARTTLGFVPSATPDDLPRWRDFLARRYRRIGALNDAYHTQWNSFDVAPLPTEIPPDGAPLLDWYQFEAVVLAMRRTAHRFTVLLPTPETDAPDGAEHRRRHDLVERLITLEKPAHTVFDVKFFWAAFRVGEVRLGHDTILDLGSRAFRPLLPMTLGQGFLAEGVLAPGHPYNVSDRRVLGRDRLGETPSL